MFPAKSALILHEGSNSAITASEAIAIGNWQLAGQFISCMAMMSLTSFVMRFLLRFRCFVNQATARGELRTKELKDWPRGLSLQRLRRRAG